VKYHSIKISNTKEGKLPSSTTVVLVAVDTNAAGFVARQTSQHVKADRLTALLHENGCANENVSDDPNAEVVTSLPVPELSLRGLLGFSSDTGKLYPVPAAVYPFNKDTRVQVC